MKNLLLKLRTMVVVLLIIVGGVAVMWLIEIIGGIAKFDNGIGGTIIFSAFGLGFVAVIIFFFIKKPEYAHNNKEVSKQDLIKENVYNEIKRKHSS